MNIAALLGDGSMPDLFARVLCYTVYYGTIAYVPLRLAAVLVARVNERTRRRQVERIRRPRAMQASYVIR